MTSRWLRFVLPCPLFFCLVIVSTQVNAADHDDGKTVILPESFELVGPAARHSVLVQTIVDGQIRKRPQGKLVVASSAPKVVRMEGNTAFPVADGTAEITVRRQGETKLLASASVSVRDSERRVVWSFRNDVQPLLAKNGCNSGACHGALAGKGGLKLSLRGYDTNRDHFVITRQARGRRVELADPGRSLILAKPSGAIAHKGGLRFDIDSREYQVLSGWIADGAQPPSENDAVLTSLKITPPLTVLAKGDSQNLLVQAVYSNGETRDVTDCCKFTSTNESVANVDTNGRVEIIGSGEGAVTAWFDSQIVIARVTSPYPLQVDEKIFARAFDNIPQRGFIDEEINKQLRRLNLPPSPKSTDDDFVRRVYLDCLGALPTAAETRSFLDDKSPDKRDRLIDSLLARPEFVDYWTYKWSDVLMVNGNLLRPDAVKSYYKWIRSHVDRNTPWDKFVTEILTAQGGTLKNGATNFYSLNQDAEGMMENACQAFLGLSIGCAKCHNHPLEKWTNNQYYGMANMFARVRAKGWGGDARSGNGDRTVYVAARGYLIQPLTGKPQPPTPLDGAPLEQDDPGDRRIHLAKWMTSPENPYFARSITNRVWQNFFSVGLVEPVDDMRDSNPASNEQLLNAAADFLVEHKFDLKMLMREIMRSESYQRSSEPLPGNRGEHRFYSRYYPKRLMAEVLLDAISQVSSSPSKFDQILFPGHDRRKTDFYPIGTKAIQLYDSAVDSYFLKTFGRNQRRITCECERSDEPTLVQVLHLSNGLTLNEKLKAAENRIGKQIKDRKSDEQIMDELFVIALSRHPNKRERTELLKALADTPEDERRVALEDMYWGVLSSREFIFNH